MTGHHKQMLPVNKLTRLLFYFRIPAGGVRLRTYGDRGGGRNHRSAKRNHSADCQEADRNVDPRELLPLVVPEVSLEPVSDRRRGGTPPSFTAPRGVRQRTLARRFVEERRSDEG